MLRRTLPEAMGVRDRAPRLSKQIGFRLSHMGHISLSSMCCACVLLGFRALLEGERRRNEANR